MKGTLSKLCSQSSHFTAAVGVEICQVLQSAASVPAFRELSHRRKMSQAPAACLRPTTSAHQRAPVLFAPILCFDKNVHAVFIHAAPALTSLMSCCHGDCSTVHGGVMATDYSLPIWGQHPGKVLWRSVSQLLCVSWLEICQRTVESTSVLFAASLSLQW